MMNDTRFFLRCGVISGVNCIELPGVLAVVGHDDAAAAGGVEDDFAVVGLFLESVETEDALGQLEHAVEADALDLLPAPLTGEIFFVVFA